MWECDVPCQRTALRPLDNCVTVRNRLNLLSDLSPETLLWLANITFELTYNPPDPRVIQLIDDVTNNNSETKALLSPISGSREKLKHPAHPYSDPEVPSLRSQRLQMGRGQINPAVVNYKKLFSFSGSPDHKFFSVLFGSNEYIKLN
ncbi:hypothetical protein HELRODRAFT_179180 [Helobdella robusta]|uniref:Uncharacterized protein n=1 Tax=Helobdella robusta TaxID=6412 RepID=T1FEB2_HELRO|nr:hypothetical protein HELRODRAFT_179180 [Helobdella robusta]ESN95705.1 hypothetical protein HELRODRAFT_179180 [Helobdella robusta]